MKALIYCRVSTDEQAGEDRLSLKTQISLCKKAIEDGGIYELAENGAYEDPGRSATNMNRPGLQDLLIRVQEDKTIKAIFVQDTDRLARNASDHLTIRALLKKHDVKLISVSQGGIDDTPEGNLMDLVIAGVNQFQSQITSRKTIKNLEQKFWSGWWPTLAQVGYLNVGDPDNPKKRIVAIDPERAPLIKEGLRLYATGDYSVLEVSEALYKRGLISKNNKRIPLSKMIELFKNTFYYGEMNWHGLTNKGNHQPLISKDLFLRCQQVMAEHNRYACRRRKYNFLLRGFVFCAHCLQRFIGEHHIKKEKSYYHCARSGIRPTKCGKSMSRSRSWKNRYRNSLTVSSFQKSSLKKL